MKFTLLAAIRKFAHYRSHRHFGNKQLGKLCIEFALVLGDFKKGLMKWNSPGIGYLGNFHLSIRKIKVGIVVINERGSGDQSWSKRKCSVILCLQSIFVYVCLHHSLKWYCLIVVLFF